MQNIQCANLQNLQDSQDLQNIRTKALFSCALVSAIENVVSQNEIKALMNYHLVFSSSVSFLEGIY